MKNRNAKTNLLKTALAALGWLGVLSFAVSAHAATILNPSFEANSFTEFPGYVNQGGNGTINDWTASGGAGLNPAGGSPFADNGVIPDGSQIAFIQNGAAASLSTVISDLTVGESYKVNFRVNARSGNTALLKIDIDGNNIINTGVTSVGGANPYKYFAFDFTATATSQTMTLRNDAGGDNTVVIDDFSIATSNTGWSYAAWNDDATSGVDSSKPYTHAYDFASAAGTTINGITFTGVTGGNPTVVNKFSTAGLANVFNNDPNNVTEGSRAMANDFLYGGPAQSITITGLEIGAEYVATIYSVGWENGTRAATFSVGEDRLTINQDHFGDNNGIAFSYRYIATDVTVTLNFVQLEGNSIHVYGFSNYELNPPRVPEIVNPSFEVDPVPAFPGYGSITGWSVTGGGINNASGPFHDNGVIPDGAQVAFVQTDGALSQVVSGFVVGSSYQIRYFENARNCCSGTAPFVELKVAGNTVVAAHASPPVGGSNPYRQVVSDAFVATASSMEIAFIKSNPQGGDTTLLIDNVGFLLPGTAPIITVQPQGQMVGLGSTVTLTVAALGSAPLSYQWFKNGGEISGATDTSLTFSPVAQSDAGDYTVRVSNPAGNVTSAVAAIVVRDLVTTMFNTGVDDSGAALPDGTVDSHYKIIVNPDAASSDAFVEDSTAFPIVGGPWVANNAGSKWIGPRPETSGSAGAEGSGGDYVYRTVVDLTGFDPASIVILGDWSTDNAGIDILINGQSTGQGNTVQFGGFTPFTINSGFLAGLNNIDFKLNNSAVGYTGLRVDHVRALGTALPAGTAPFIVQQPQDVTATLGERVTFSVRANGSPALSYQWYYGPDPLFDETRPELSFSFDFADVVGDYSVEVTSPFGSVRSAAAKLIFRDVPLVITQPQSQAVAIGESVTFSVTANGVEPLSYQWMKNGADIPGANSPTYNIASAVSDDAGVYSVRVSNTAGSDTSDDATLAVLQVIPGLFNTGVDASGVSLPSGSVDPHWIISSSADPAFPGPDAVVLNDSGFPIPPWLANDEISKWISPQASQGTGNLEGDYTYKTSFDLTGYNPANVVVTGEWAVDNFGLDILINGISTGQRNDAQFVVWTPFQINSGFVSGVNTVEFKMNNAPTGVNPTGFRVRNFRALGVPLPPPNNCPVAAAQSLTVDAGASVNSTFSASDADGDALTYALASNPAHGIVVVQTQTGAFTYTPNAGYSGPDSFSFTATDGRCVSEPATVSITVRQSDQPPTAKITLDQLVDFSPDYEHPVLISCNWWNSCLLLDGTLSSDPENGALTYLWFLESDPVPFAAGAVATNCLELGTYTILLTVTDPAGQSGTDTKTLEIITAPLGVELLIEKVNQSYIPRRTKRELVATLRVALKQSGDNKLRQTQATMDVFEKKVRAQVAPNYPEEATAWIRWSQSITEGMENCIKPPPKHKKSDGKGGKDDDDDDNGGEEQPN